MDIIEATRDAIHCETHGHDGHACFMSSFEGRHCVWWFIFDRECEKCANESNS